MEDEVRKNVKFRTMLSSDSGDSILSDESCIYYQTEIFTQLPSSQAFRPHARQGERVGGVAQDAEPKPGENRCGVPLDGGSRDKASSEPLRSLAMCMQAKREARDRRRLQMPSIGSWESWRRSQSIAGKRLWQQVGGAIPRLLPWRQTLHTIEGRFGVGVKAYFLFLRYLIFCSVLHCVIISSCILGPSWRFGRGSTSETLAWGGNDSFTDFFLGSGFLERSPLFYGFYTRGSLDLPCLNTPLLFLIGILNLLILSLVMVVRRMVVGYKHTWLLGNRYNFHLSYKIFCVWDYNIHNPPMAALEHSFIWNDLKVFLEEQRFHEREAQRTWAQWARLYFLRVFINFLVVSMLGGAFVLIYMSTEISQKQAKKSEGNWLVSVLWQYLGPLTITLVNLLFPHVFRIFSSFEDYSLTTQVNATLLRSIFLKLACLGIYLLSLFRKDKQECWENQFGKEMYKLCLFDFLAGFCNTFFFAYPRKVLVARWPSSWLARVSGPQRFQIPLNVLDLVYTQTVSWVGVFYCPLLPLLGTAKLVAVLYMKKFMVLRCCVPEQRMFRASSSKVLFHLMLLLGLVMAIATLGINLQVERSPGCGPFDGTASVFNVTGVCVDSLAGPAQTTLRYLSSEAFALPLILAEIVILTSLMSRGRANRKTIDRLKDMLVMCSSDKRFLVKQHATLLRHHGRNHSTPAHSQEDSPLP